jgi:hypothetical protein
MLWAYLSFIRTRELFNIKRKGIELSTGKILVENLVQSAFQQTQRQIQLSAGQ